MTTYAEQPAWRIRVWGWIVLAGVLLRRLPRGHVHQGVEAMLDPLTNSPEALIAELQDEVARLAYAGSQGQDSYLAGLVSDLDIRVTAIERSRAGWRNVLHVPPTDSSVVVRASDLAILLDQNGGLDGRGFGSEDERVAARDRLYRALGDGCER